MRTKMRAARHGRSEWRFASELAVGFAAAALLLVGAVASAEGDSPSEWERERLDRNTPSTSLPGRSWVSVMGGYWGAVDGTGGGSFGVRFLHAPGSPQFLIGAEFMFKSYQTTLDNIPNMDVDAYDLRVLGRYRLLRDFVVIPYLGAGIGFGFASMEEPQFSVLTPGVFVRQFAGTSTTTRISFGLNAVAGIDVPIRVVRGLELFVEARLDGAIALRSNALDSITSNKSTFKTQNMSGGGALAGASYRF